MIQYSWVIMSLEKFEQKFDIMMDDVSINMNIIFSLNDCSECLEIMNDFVTSN